MVLDVAASTQVIAAATPVALDYGALATKAIGGGASGALAGVVQVSSLMWLRTAMNYQYANGGNGTLSTVATLYEEGGLPRLYRGVQYALVQNPLSRFGDAAANAAVPALVISLVPGCVEIKILRRPHAIDATPARWRGDTGSSPLDRASATTPSPRNDLVKNCRVHPTHWLISTQV